MWYYNTRYASAYASQGLKSCGSKLFTLALTELQSKNGTVKDVLIDSNVNYHPNGAFKHTRCFIRDDTARKLEEEKYKLQLDEAERTIKLKDDFLYTVAHDLRFDHTLQVLEVVLNAFRTPMQALLGTVQLLDPEPSNRDQKELTDIIIESGNQLCDMLVTYLKAYTCAMFACADITRIGQRR
jgi:hypothetical protein